MVPVDSFQYVHAFVYIRVRTKTTKAKLKLNPVGSITGLQCGHRWVMGGHLGSLPITPCCQTLAQFSTS